MNRSNEHSSDKHSSSTTDRSTGGNLPDARAGAGASAKDASAGKQHGREATGAPGKGAAPTGDRDHRGSGGAKR